MADTAIFLVISPPEGLLYSASWLGYKLRFQLNIRELAGDDDASRRSNLRRPSYQQTVISHLDESKLTVYFCGGEASN